MILYSILLITGLLFSIIIIYTKAKSSGLTSIAYFPIVLFTVFFAVVHFLTPLLKQLEGFNRYQFEYEPLILIYSALLSIIYLAFALMVNNRFSSNTKRIIARNRISLIENRDQSIKIALQVGVVLGLIGGFYAWRDLNTIQGTAGSMNEFLRDRHLASADRSGSRLFASFLVPACVSLLAASVLSKRKFVPFLVFLAFLSFYVYYSNSISSRNSILVILIMSVMTYLFLKSEVIGTVKLGFVKMFVLSLIALMTIGLAYVTTTQRYSIDSDYTEARRDSAFFYMMDGAFGNDEARPWMIQNGQEYFFGKTYIAAFTNVVPRSIWSGKPVGAGPELINMIRPGSYIIGSAGNNSLTTGIIVEARMNFGVPGVFLVILIFAYIANRLTVAAVKTQDLMLKLMYILVITSMGSTLIYSEFLGYFTRLAMIMFPLWFASRILQLVTRPTRSIRGR